MKNTSPILRSLPCVALLLTAGATTSAQVFPSVQQDPAAIVYETESGTILAADPGGTYWFRDWSEYAASDFFRIHGKRCGAGGPGLPVFAGTADCSNGFTNPAAEYDPSVAHYRIPVVVHVIQHPNGNGFISDAQVQSQIDILNEDFQALPGSNGQFGTDTSIEFYLATADPSGNPTNGITRHTSSKWYNDSGNYAAAAGDEGVAGQTGDGVRILWTSFGANAPIGQPYNLGRTTTHEVGHYLGLYHTFQGGCASASGCASNGDLICDTNPEAQPNFFPCTRSSCGSPDPTNNYLDYSDDVCMTEFTPIQAKRMRCTVQNFRPLLIQDLGDPNASPSVDITAPSNGASFDEGTSINFTGTASDPEDGPLSSSLSWSSNLDGALGTGSSIGATLSVGSHTVTASVTDSGGASGSDAISVTVNPVGGGGFTLSASGFKVKGKHNVDLSWSGAAGASVEIYRDGSLLTTTANDGAYTDSTNNKGGATYVYQVCETGGSPCSNTATVVF